ncbi:transcriptional regulator GlxA family with amidase domain [Paraburkholderia sp. GAS206C]|jgi:transcriptional regulator GlxA family with amidase domain|uniref:Transcriptional regulator, AraC family with amidase-like domain n=2 Tax=Burkholderiaceae TaxID=119060 RepID=A0A1N6HHC9_9BURK|nr:transcriptional regulator, AraC family with amidase-like domain [Paraburkholderia phenazinium]
MACYFPGSIMLRIGYIVVPGFQVMVFGGLTVFELANRLTREPYYEIRLISESGGPVQSSLGYSVMTDSFEEGAFDTVIIGGVITGAYPASAALIEYLRGAVKNTRRVASMCTGAFFLAQAGVLDDRRATTHWAHARELQTTYPKVKVEEDRIFVVDGPVWTSAGMTAGTDLAVSMVERDLGAKVARIVAKRMVMFHRRAGGQLQHSTLLDLDAKTDRIQTALVYAKSNLHTPLTVDRLAEAANLSVRQFSRAFREETGQSPAKAVENLRLEAARLMVEQGRLPIDVVARETGFADPDRMRRAFLRAFGEPPQAIRRNARGQADS